MKNPLSVVFLLAAFLTACEEHREVDPAGKSDFILVNETADSVYFHCVLTGEFTQSPPLRGTIPGNDQLVLFHGLQGIIAWHPVPADVFTAITFFSDADYTEKVYEQDPVADSLWIAEIPEGYAAWEYTKYRLYLQP